jgi:hypothetical protein
MKQISGELTQKSSFVYSHVLFSIMGVMLVRLGYFVDSDCIIRDH